MKNYITSDKVGEFVQSMFNAGFENLVISPDNVSVKHTDGSYTHITVFRKCSYEDLVNRVLDKEKSLLLERLPQSDDNETEE